MPENQDKNKTNKSAEKPVKKLDTVEVAPVSEPDPIEPTPITEPVPAPEPEPAPIEPTPIIEPVPAPEPGPIEPTPIIEPVPAPEPAPHVDPLPTKPSFDEVSYNNWVVNNGRFASPAELAAAMDLFTK